MGSVYRLTLRQLTGRWRLTLMAVLALMPLVITALMLSSAHAADVAAFEEGVLGAMLAGAIAPLVVLAIAAPAFGNEIEDRSLANLTLAPLARWRIAVPKLFAVLTVAGPFMAASAMATSWLAFLGDPRAVLAVTVAAVAGVALYAAVFVWLGLVSSQAIGIGLVYIVVWEGLFSRNVAGVRLLSIRHYATSLMHGIDARRFAWSDPMSVGAVSVVAALVFAGFVALSVRRLRTMDVP